MPSHNTPVTPAERLIAFKSFMQGDFVQQTKDRFGEDIYNSAISGQLEDMLECIELHIEDLAEQDVQDNEIMDDDEYELGLAEFGLDSDFDEDDTDEF